ncbi:hypothetical protein GCM10007391_20520 [Alteromonas halophila]|uniref:Uncharacterized protein n=1 Tax=Alteromonas halophila TaxID=516698 RepID=A0A918JKZ7_9ALTE|nr:hypothetical protein GCM10007391_20520 [Alteromonas halophila]
MANLTALTIKVQQPAGRALWGWVFSNEVFGKRKIKILSFHGVCIAWVKTGTDG